MDTVSTKFWLASSVLRGQSLEFFFFALHLELTMIETCEKKSLFDYVHEDEDIRLLRAAFLGEPNVQLLPTPSPDQPIACECRPYQLS